MPLASVADIRKIFRNFEAPVSGSMLDGLGSARVGTLFLGKLIEG